MYYKYECILMFSCRACRCSHVEIACHILARLDDPMAELLQVTKGSVILRVLASKAKKEHYEILDALFRKYKDYMQEHVFDRNRACTIQKKYSKTPISIACQYIENHDNTGRINNEGFIRWSLRCFNNTLTVIDLYNSSLRGKLPLLLFEFVKLKVINVSRNNLTGVTNEAGDHQAFACAELEEAIFCDNKFTFIPKSLFLLPKLKILNFASNEIDHLYLNGIDIKSVPIMDINLSYNNIEVIPSQLFYFPKLMNLNLDGNRIAQLPVQMWFSPRLVCLSVNNNALLELPVPTEPQDEKELPKEFSSFNTNEISVTSSFSFSFRETMMAHYEAIEFEEMDINMAEGLKKLQLNGNKLQQIPVDLGCLTPHLSELSIADNELAVSLCLKSLPVLLKKLNLSGNNLTTFLTPFFASNYPPENCTRKKFIGLAEKCSHTSHKVLANLTRLDMSHNQIDDDINTKYSNYLCYEKLIDLNLSYNNFKTFPEFILHQPSLSMLDISHNLGIEKIPSAVAKLPLMSFQYRGISDPIVRTLDCYPHNLAAKLQCLRMFAEK